MDRHRALAATAVALAALLVLLAVWHAVQAPAEGPVPVALASTTPPPDEPRQEAEAAVEPAPEGDEGEGTVSSPPADPEGRNETTQAGAAPTPQNRTATCSFRQQGVRSPEQSVGVLDSGVRCQFRVDPLPWAAVRVTVRVDGVQVHEELTATLYAHRVGGMRVLGNASSEAVVGDATLVVEADPAALGPYRVFELELDGLGASSVDVRVDALLTF